MTAPRCDDLRLKCYPAVLTEEDREALIGMAGTPSSPRDIHVTIAESPAVQRLVRLSVERVTKHPSPGRNPRPYYKAHVWVCYSPGLIGSSNSAELVFFTQKPAAGEVEEKLEILLKK